MYLVQPGKYWGPLLASQMFGWLLLALASRALPHRWQERSAAGESRGRLGRWIWRQKAGPAQRARAREQLLPVNPVLWLMSSESGLRRIAWMIVWVWGAMVLLVTLYWPNNGGASVYLSLYGVSPFGFLLKWLFALQACRFFVEARRSGALEMLLCTPLTSRDIIRGQVLALRNSFLWPIASLLALLFVPAMTGLFTARAWDFPGPHHLALEPEVFGFLTAGGYCLRMVADCFALGAFGMWLALTLKKPGLAPALTILFVLILPSFLCWLDILADLFFILWGVMKLSRADLRSLAAQEYQPVTVTPGLPPVIAT
jgi:hypothetical protein